MTIGHSKTVEAFLKSAGHSRNYTVIVAETAPSYSGHDMASALSAAGISTFLVPDSSIYAIMSRVNKIILGAHAILANGGLVAITGSLLAATAARAHSTPVVVCAGQFKLTPSWNLYHEYGALDFADPSSVLGFEEGKLVERVDVVNPYYDYVGPELVDVFITNECVLSSLTCCSTRLIIGQMLVTVCAVATIRLHLSIGESFPTPSRAL